MQGLFVSTAARRTCSSWLGLRCRTPAPASHLDPCTRQPARQVQTLLTTATELMKGSVTSPLARCDSPHSPNEIVCPAPSTLGERLPIGRQLSASPAPCCMSATSPGSDWINKPKMDMQCMPRRDACMVAKNDPWRLSSVLSSVLSIQQPSWIQHGRLHASRPWPPSFGISRPQRPSARDGRHPSPSPKIPWRLPSTECACQVVVCPRALLSLVCSLKRDGHVI